MSDSPAARQLCRRFARRQLACIEKRPGQFSIDEDKIALTYFGQGSWQINCWPLNGIRFHSKSTSEIVSEVTRCIKSRDEIMQTFLSRQKPTV